MQRRQLFAFFSFNKMYDYLPSLLLSLWQPRGLDEAAGGEEAEVSSFFTQTTAHASKKFDKNTNIHNRRRIVYVPALRVEKGWEFGRKMAFFTIGDTSR